MASCDCKMEIVDWEAFDRTGEDQPAYKIVHCSLHANAAALREALEKSAELVHAETSGADITRQHMYHGFAVCPEPACVDACAALAAARRGDTMTAYRQTTDDDELGTWCGACGHPIDPDHGCRDCGPGGGGLCLDDGTPLESACCRAIVVYGRQPGFTCVRCGKVTDLR